MKKIIKILIVMQLLILPTISLTMFEEFELKTKYENNLISKLTKQQKQLLLIASAKSNHDHLVEALISDPEIDINATDENGQTALLQAESWGRKKIIKLLRDSGAKDILVYRR